MTATELYQQIADAYHGQGKYQERDRFLVLAVDAAHTAGQNTLAERLRARLLELNPNHLIKPYPSVPAALQAQNFVTYLSQLRKNYPISKAQSLLNELAATQKQRPKRTMLAESSFPSAEPIDDRQQPAWSQMDVTLRTKVTESPVSRRMVDPELIPFEPPPLTPTIPMQPYNDPLANVPPPVSRPAPLPFSVEPPQRRPEIVPAPPRVNSSIVESASGVWIGNLLFVVLFLASLVLLGYVFVLPFYPEVAKMVKL
jgi:hypothetical protein